MITPQKSPIQSKTAKQNKRNKEIKPKKYLNFLNQKYGTINKRNNLFFFFFLTWIYLYFRHLGFLLNCLYTDHVLPNQLQGSELPT